MKKTTSLLLAVLVLFCLMAAAGHAAPAAQGANLLQNPGFEQPYGGGAADKWQRWNMTTAKSDSECLVAYHVLPKWNVETGAGFVREGAASQYVGNNWDTWGGGVYQTVPATPGTTYRFSFYGRGRGTNEASPAPSEAGLQMNMRAGIDPNGSGNWADGDVVWGAAGSPHDAWQEFSVQATATGNQITVFTSANWGVTGVNQCRQFLDTWYDAAQLVAETPPTATPPPPTAAIPTEPVSVATATSEATTAAPTTAATSAAPAATATATGNSTICVNAFLDANGNGLHDAEEGYVSGVTLTVAQGNAVTGQAVSTGQQTPICFGNLPAGTYQVAQTLPTTLEMTTQANATINLAIGQTLGLEFGSRLRGAATPGTEPSPTAAMVASATAPASTGATTGGSPTWMVFLGLGAILIGVLLLGVLLFMVLRR